MDSGNGDAVMSGETHVRNRLSVLYRDPCLSDEDVLMLAETRGEVFNAQARGLCSRIYRLPDGTVHGTTMEGCREKPSICIKRVVEEDQVAPHAVEREVLSYSLMWEALRATQEDVSAKIIDSLVSPSSANDPTGCSTISCTFLVLSEMTAIRSA